MGKLNSNKYHKDHFYYIFDLDLFMCPEGQPWYFYKEYVGINEDPIKPYKIKRLYSNYYACKHCIQRESCLSEKHIERLLKTAKN